MRKVTQLTTRDLLYILREALPDECYCEADHLLPCVLCQYEELCKRLDPLPEMDYER